MSKGILEPDPHLHDVPGGIRDEMHIDLLAQRNVCHADIMVEERNAPIAVGDPCLTQTEDVFR
jgi:hypothetical protein